MGDILAGPDASIERLVQDSLSESFQAFKKDLVLYIIANLIVVVLSIASVLVLAGPLSVGFIDIVRKRRRGEAASVGDVFGGFSRFATAFIATLLIGIGVMLGTLMLVIPGLLFAAFAVFTLQAVAYRETTAVAALKESFGLVKDNFVGVLALLVILIVINAIGGMVAIGFLLTGPFTTILLTVAYEKLSAARGG